MLGYIDGYNFKEMAPMKYWAPPSSWTEEKKKETTRSRIFSGDWFAAEKKDGYFSKLVKDEDGNCYIAEIFGAESYETLYPCMIQLLTHISDE